MEVQGARIRDCQRYLSHSYLCDAACIPSTMHSCMNLFLVSAFSRQADSHCFQGKKASRHDLTSARTIYIYTFITGVSCLDYMIFRALYQSIKYPFAGLGPQFDKNGAMVSNILQKKYSLLQRLRYEISLQAHYINRFGVNAFPLCLDSLSVEQYQADGCLGKVWSRHC